MNVSPPNRETTLCLSLAKRPGTFGVRFHNFLFRKYNLNFLYLARQVDDITAAVAGVRALQVRGCAVTMPYKELALPLMDELDDSAQRVGALNTIINTQGRLKGYNTDTWAVRKLLQKEKIPSSARVTVLGAGGMARAVLAALQAEGFSHVVVVARDTAKKGLAREFDCSFQEWKTPLSSCDLLVNATSLGFQQASLPEALKGYLPSSPVIWDVIGDPSPSAFIQAARNAGAKTVAGAEISRLQAQKQFELYTGITLSEADVDAAFAHASGK